MTNAQLTKYGLIKPMSYEPWHVELIETRGLTSQQKPVFYFQYRNGWFFVIVIIIERSFQVTQRFKPIENLVSILCLMGKQLLMMLSIELDQLTHRNFLIARDMFDDKKEELYNSGEVFLLKCIHESLNYINESLNLIDGRTKAIFRRFDIVEKYLKNPPKLF